MSASTDNRKYTGTGTNLTRDQYRNAFNGPVGAAQLLKVGCLAGQLFSDTTNNPGVLDYVADGTMRCIGFVTLGADNSVGSLGQRATRVVAETGMLIDKNAGGGSAITAADVDKPAYGVDNQTVSKLSSDGPCIGLISGIDGATGNPVILVDPVTAAQSSGRAVAPITKAQLALFVSTEQTGTGASQNIAHGLGVVPSAVVVSFTNIAATPTSVTEGTHTTTNAVVTVTSGAKFKVTVYA